MAELLEQSNAAINMRSAWQQGIRRHFTLMLGDAAAVGLLLGYGANTEQIDIENRTPLIVAAQHGRLAVARLLLEHGADVQAATQEGTTALLAACAMGHLKIATLLLNEGADVNSCDERGRTPLYLATATGHLALAQLLLDYNARMDASSPTPLDAAVNNHSVEMVKLLLSYGANPTLVSTSGTSPLSLALSRGHIGLAMLLRHRAPLHLSVRTTRMGLVERLLYRNPRLPVDDDVHVSFADRSDTGAILFTAVHCNNLVFVRRLLSRGVDPNVPAKAGFTPLLLAVARNLLEVAKELLDAGADPEIPNDARYQLPSDKAKLLLDYRANPNTVFMGGSLFILAAKQRRLPYLEQLLSTRRVDINQTDSNGRTGFEYTCLYGDLDCVKLLVSYGVNDVAAEGKTQLMFAAKHGSVAIAAYLLPLSDINAISDNGYTAVAVAAYYGHLDIIRLLVAHGAHLDQVSENAVFPLRIAAQEGHSAVVQYLVPLLDDVDRRNCHGDTALYMAAQNQHTEIVRCLCAKANVNLAMEDGSTSLWRACLDGSVDIVDILLDAGADVNMPSFDGNRPLITAAEKGHLEVVTRLLKETHRLDLNAQNQDGKTALYQASCFGHAAICRALLAAGADVSIATSKGVAPIVIAIVVQNIDIVELLLAHVDINAPLLGASLLFMAVQRRSVAIVELLVRHGADVDAIAENGQTPLVAAAHMGALEIVRALLPFVRDVDAPYRDGYTALSVAVEQGHLPVVRALADGGANLLQVTAIGLTLLHIASFSGWCDIAAYLIGLGANIFAMDKIGGRSIVYAVTNGHADVAELLLPYVDVNAEEASTREVMVLPHDEPALRRDLNAGFSLVHIASAQNQVETLATLMKAPALDVNKADPTFGLTALHIACGSGHLPILQLLLIHRDIDVNAVDKDGRTGLHIACLYGQPAVVSALLACPTVDRTAETRDGTTGFVLACNRGFVDIAAMLIQEPEIAIQVALHRLRS
ncbi:hypothetical protein ACHHYP_15493 [Achlya hypogyna]|uniref:Uncharacterized protein n=1 Tax=Achlya hypogyna TaxID=1202772 RepID=A0A1V9ZET6_ACHHY|nr:hypothetical protein ACHHYP_15493 [Achlya hypogyna]